MKNSEIAWTDHTFNPWIGCTKVSPGCVNCYAENETFARVQRKNGRELWGKGKPRHRTSAAYWKEPIKWNEEAGIAKTKPRVFCGSMCDWLDGEVPIEWFADLLKLIHDTPNLQWLLLTKRPENFSERMELATDCLYLKRRDKYRSYYEWCLKWEGRGFYPNNIWIGTTCENQAMADKRIPELLKIPAKVRFLSVEPMLGQVDLTLALEGLQPFNPDLSRKPAPVDWVIFGGESGKNARPCAVEWIRDGVKQCKSAGVPVFVKQMGSNVFDQADAVGDGAFEDGDGWPKDTIYTEVEGEEGGRFAMVHCKSKAGRDVSEWPQDLRVQESPKNT